MNSKISDESVFLLVEIAKKSHIGIINLYGTSISSHFQDDIRGFAREPIEDRSIPTSSPSKSAAKLE